MSGPPARGLVLAVIDGLKPSMLQRAVASGRAPALAAVLERGTSTEACASFPSVTPVCAASIATGTRNDRHHIPSMNWFHRAEDRYVEYGSSFSAARRFGVVQQLTDTVFNMNAEHLPADCETVFESLDDVDVRTAGTTYLMYRGRHEHELSRSSAITRLASQVVRRTVMGPRELFYADLFASRDTGCRGQFGLPGVRDQHTGCVGSYLVEHDLCDFLLFSLPDNDTHSHARGPHAQVQSIATADRQLERLFHAGGGTERVPRRVGGRRHGRPLPRRGRAQRRPARRVRGLARPAAQRRPARRGRARGLPGAARGDGLRARRPRRARTPCRGSWPPPARWRAST